MQHFNLHTHSTYSDGKSPMEDTIEEAIRQGMHTIGFSDHSSLPFPSRVSIPMNKNNEYAALLKSLRQKYLGKIDVLASMEMEFIPGIVVDFEKTKRDYQLDYLIGSVHLVGKTPDTLWFIDGKDVEPYDTGLQKYFGGDIKKGVRAYFDQENEMIETEKFDIIGHFDKVKMNSRGRYFHEDEKWYRDMVLETLDLIKQHDLIVEINTRGLYKQRYNGFYPSEWLLPRMKELNIPVLISSDAHLSEELTYYFKEAEEALKKVGYKETMCFKNGHWISEKL